MSHIDGCVSAASAASTGAFIERIRTNTTCADDLWRWSRPHPVATIGVFANLGGMRA
ncbi:hypothetical protein [Pseudoxanthomonas wuyuanensis]